LYTTADNQYQISRYSQTRMIRSSPLGDSAAKGFTQKHSLALGVRPGWNDSVFIVWQTGNAVGILLRNTTARLGETQQTFMPADPFKCAKAPFFRFKKAGSLFLRVNKYQEDWKNAYLCPRAGAASFRHTNVDIVTAVMIHHRTSSFLALDGGVPVT